MIYRTDPYAAHTHAVDVLAAVGITPPAEWLELRDRFATRADDTTMLDRLVAAIRDGSRADLTALRAGALAETLATPQAHATVTNATKAAVLHRLRQLYAPHAAPNYDAVADQFDITTNKLAKAVTVVDPEADPASIVAADTKTRTAWTDATLAATELDRLLPILQSAAELAGVNTNTRESLLALVVDPGQLHRRRVWEAFDREGGRCGRWGALVALGAQIRAQRPITDLKPYRQPRPFEERWEQIRRGQSRRIVVDPEDEQESHAAP